MKNPAVLFYTSDFLSGTILMSNEDTGRYIKLLCLQHQIYPDRIPENHMISVCLSHDSCVIKKFVKDEKGFYYNERMEQEIKKRVSFCESRSNNKSGRPPKESYDSTYDKSHDIHMNIHMGNGNDNENKDVIKRLKEEKKVLESQIETIYQAYPKKKDKGHAIKSIRSSLDKCSYDKLLDHVKKYAQSVVGKDPQFIPYPATWFNGLRWEDQEEIKTEKQLRDEALAKELAEWGKKVAK
jgi:hypothetical protein